MINSLSDLYATNRNRVENHLDDLDNYLKKAGWNDGIDSLTKATVVQLYLIVDAVILDVKYTAWIGYLLGASVGLWSLFAVLVQHKRISIAVSDELRAMRSEAQTHGIPTENPWPDFQKRYPILRSCFFLAILSSTAVVQLQIVGATVSILLALCMNVTKLAILVEVFGFYILAYVLVFILDFFVMHFSGTCLVSYDGTQIRHPRWFNFVIAVLSTVSRTSLPVDS